MKPRLPLQSKTFWAYLTSFLSIVLLPLIVIWILLSTVLNRSVQAQFLTYESQILRSVSEQVDANVSYSIYASYYLGGNRAFRRLMMETELPRNTREDSVREVSGYLRDVIGTASINALSCVYLPHRDLVVTASGGMYSFEGFYNQILNFSDCSAEELLSQLRAVSAPAFLRPVTQALSGQQWLCMAVHISAGYLNRPAYLLAFYQVDKLTNVLTQRLPDQSLFSICSPEGEYLTGTAPLLPLPEGEEILSHQIDGAAYLAFLETSSVSGLRFVYYLPQAHVLRQLTVYQRVFVAVLCALLALCGAMAFLLAYRHYLPIRRLFQRAFPSAIPSGRELERVSESLEQARKQGEVYSRQVRSQYAQLAEPAARAAAHRGRARRRRAVRPAGRVSDQPGPGALLRGRGQGHPARTPANYRRAAVPLPHHRLLRADPALRKPRQPDPADARAGPRLRVEPERRQRAGQRAEPVLP